MPIKLILNSPSFRDMPVRGPSRLDPSRNFLENKGRLRQDSHVESQAQPLKAPPQLIQAPLDLRLALRHQFL